MSLQEVKILLGADDERVDILYSKTEQKLLNRLKRSLPLVLTVPEELEFIVEELTIMRFNRLGSEGMQSESMDGHSATYGDTDLRLFEREISEYIHGVTDAKRGVVRFL
jgi:hypothetical protein